MSERDVERALVDLGRHIRYPAAPDLVAAVTEGIANVRPLARAPRRRRRAVLLAAAVLLLVVGGLSAFVPAVRAALVRIITLGAVRIEVGAPPVTPTPLTPDPTAAQLDLGRRVTLAEAQAEISFDIRVPDALGQPDATYLDALEDVVWLTYQARLGIPAADETGVGVLIGELRGRPEGEFLLKKLPPEGAVVEPVMVGEEHGFWVSGPPHDLFFIGRDGQPIFDRARLAGNTLIWTDGEVTYRLESALARDAAIALAETFR